ncbi:MAG: SMC family ATPase [Acidimicrobiia bacterium]|nr:SMC family ATPase [Acidimicrobiia bacterium]
MKPIELRMAAFGSYPGTEVIDFEALATRGLFVVSGDTGTGKTTIFDAMCWALYGDMPGKKANEVRSHHVPDHIRTEVRFTFECSGERYVVTRNPKQQRPGKHGKKLVAELAQANLDRMTGGVTEAIATKVNDVRDRCTELIGLGPEQFQRVVLLPQGEFSRFLLANTADREPLLSQLFGGAVFDAITSELKNERAALADQVGATDSKITAQIEAARRSFERSARALDSTVPDDLAATDREGLEALAASLDAPIAELDTRTDALVETVDRLATEESTATEAARRFDSARKHQETLKQLEEGRRKVEANAAIAARSAAARPAVTADDHLTATKTSAAASKLRLDEVCGKIRDGAASLGTTVDTSSSTTVAATLNDQRERIKERRAALDAVTTARTEADSAAQRASELTEEIDRTTAQQGKDRDRVAEIDGQLPAVQAAAVDPAGIDEQLKRAAANLTARRDLDEASRCAANAREKEKDADDRYGHVLAAFIETEAPRLAETLVDDEPCPVCGAVEHPRPATAADGVLVTFDAVEEARGARAEADDALQQLLSRVAGLQGVLGDDADTPLEDLEQRRADLADRRDAATAAREQLDRLTEERSDLTKRISDAAETLAGLVARRTHEAADVQRWTEAFDKATAAAAGLELEEVERQAKVLDELDELCEGLEGRFIEVSKDAGAAVEAEGALERAVKSSPFESVAAARSVLIDLDDEEAYRTAKEQFDSEFAKADVALKTLEEQGIPAHRPDVEAVRAKLAEAKASHQVASRSLTTAITERKNLGEALQAHDELLEQSGEVRHRFQVAERVHKVCHSGGPGASMSLKRWVLTRELDRVTAAANPHLNRMTGGRYMLQRRKATAGGPAVYGLDLEVVDAQTGRARSTSSLSGGEQFQASLALALGLADVVSLGGASSGKRFEALFVDEGFGSLSAEALDDAIETLHQLHGTGRMVGAITHVDAMKQQLHVGIEVLRRADGAGSTLVVHP